MMNRMMTGMISENNETTFHLGPEGIEGSKSEELAGGRRFCIRYPKGSFYCYEKRILAEGGCSSFLLPMSFLEDECETKAYYDFSGYNRLKHAVKAKQSNDEKGHGKKKSAVCDSIDTLFHLLGHLRRMENHLLFPEIIVIGVDVLYVHMDTGNVLLAYVPDKKTTSSFQDKIINLTEEIKSVYGCTDGAPFLDRFIHYIVEKNPGLDGMISMLGMIRREAEYIYASTENFRNSVVGDRDHSWSENRDRGGTSQETVHEASSKGLLKKGQGKGIYIKIILFQLLLFCFIVMVCFYGMFDLFQLAGLMMIAVAIDFMIIKKMLPRQNDI